MGARYEGDSRLAHFSPKGDLTFLCALRPTDRDVRPGIARVE